MFADHFDKKVKNITDSLAPNLNQDPDNKLIHGNYEDCWITEAHIAKIINQLKSKRCQGYDRIPVIFYKDGQTELLQIVTCLMKKILTHNVVPDQWKIAKVIPIYKKGDKRNVNNYRPISNLCSITKIFERLILERINVIEQTEGCDLTGNKQHGFKKKHSTDTACLEVESKISGWCDNNEYVTLASLDLSAAFDVVDHKMLIKRLGQKGLPKIIVKTIENWLQNRFFYCEVKGRSSTMKKLTHGTVQGSILGPVLFAIFVSPLELKIKHLVTYADDNFILNHNGSMEVVIERAKTTTIIVRNWLVENGLKVNEEKTEICMFHKKDYQCEEIEIDNHIIKVKKSIRVLGVIFDSKLSWAEHVGFAVAKANKAKQGLSIIRRYFTTEEALKLGTAYFYSKLYYGARIWLISTLHGDLKRKLWQVSARMLKIIDANSSATNSYVSLHQKYNRASPMMWSKYSTALAMWDMVNNQVPESAVLKSVLNLLNEGRRPGLVFTRSNNTKIGFNCLANRLQATSRSLNTNWQDMPKEAFKVLCKKTFITEALRRLT